MELQTALQQLASLQQKLFAFRTASSALYLDGVTVAPRDTSEGRGVALGILAGEEHKLFSSAETGELIASLENMEATKEEISQAVAVIAHQNRMTVEELKPYYDAEFEPAVVRSVLTSKVMKLIRDSAEISQN